MSKTADAIVIGAGVIGCAVAFELGKRGYKTVSVDKLPAAGFGSTSNSCAIIRFHYSTRDGVAMAYENYFYWKDWEQYVGPVDERGYSKFIECGATIIRLAEKESQKNYLTHFDEFGIKYEVWDVATMQQKLPLYDGHSHWPPRSLEDEAFWNDPTQPLMGAIFTPQAGYINDPQLSTYNLMLAAKSVGGEFLFNEEVTEIRQQNGRVAGVTLKSGETIDAPVVVNVAGPHSFIINRLAGVEAGMNITTRALRHEVHHVPSPAEFNFEANGAVTTDSSCGIYFRPESGNHILVGSEDPECDERDWVDDPDAYNTSLTDRLWKRQVYRLAKRIPELPIPQTPSGVVDLYDVSDDWIPIYDKSELPGFYMAVGTSGNQFKNAGGVGHMLAEMIQAEENGHDLDADPLQVTMPYTGLTLNSGFYSRLREINRSSSFSVLG
ncbi:MAG: FAD-binding oxidoreductase [Anaerolineae bacterium]